MVAALPAIAVLIRVRRTSDRRSGDGGHPGAGLPGPEASDMREALLLQRHQGLPLFAQVGGPRDAALSR